MQLLKFLIGFTLFTFAYANPQSPDGDSGGGDTSGGSGGAVGSQGAAQSASARK